MLQSSLFFNSKCSSPCRFTALWQRSSMNLNMKSHCNIVWNFWQSTHIWHDREMYTSDLFTSQVDLLSFDLLSYFFFLVEENKCQGMNDCTGCNDHVKNTTEAGRGWGTSGRKMTVSLHDASWSQQCLTLNWRLFNASFWHTAVRTQHKNSHKNSCRSPWVWILNMRRCKW